MDKTSQCARYALLILPLGREISLSLSPFFYQHGGIGLSWAIIIGHPVKCLAYQTEMVEEYEC